MTLALTLAPPTPIPLHSRASDIDSTGSVALLGVVIALLMAFLLGLRLRTRKGSSILLKRSIDAFAVVAVILALVEVSLAALHGGISMSVLAVFGTVVIAAAAVTTSQGAWGDPPAAGPTRRDSADHRRPNGGLPDSEPSVAEVTAAGKVVFDDLLRLTASWTHAPNRFVAEVLKPRLNVFVDKAGARHEELHFADCWARMNCFVNARLTEAVGRMEPADAPQITVWTANGKTGKLSFAFSTQNVGPAVANATFDSGEGIAGAAFLEGMIRNEIHPARLPIFKAFPGVDYPFESMLVIPIEFGSRVLGVLCIDRMRAEHFDRATVDNMVALAHLVGLAIGLEEWVYLYLSKP